jgi:SAM-dependent methyltransferase
MTLTPNVVHRLSVCPGCGSPNLVGRLFLEKQPVILNYRFATPESAKGVERRDIDLTECSRCGLVFNAILDSCAIPYDEFYENRQNFSSAFLALLNDTADRLTQKYLSKTGNVVEVGCGKGDFLELICRHSGSKGVGYDTSCECTDSTKNGRVRFFKKYMTASDVTERIDLVICRHVVEHIPQIGEFLRLLHSISSAGGDSMVYIETPAFEWIIKNDAFWDIFYEHCNYFTTENLRRLAETAGFTVLDHRLIFGGQYQALELRPLRAPTPKPFADLNPAPVLKDLANRISESKYRLEKRLISAGAAGGWAIWGAGAKGVSLANAALETTPSFIIDSNPSKQGMYLPGLGIPVVAPSDAIIATVPVVLVANSNYLPEITNTLISFGHNPAILTL